ncbi:MAG: site-specific DNA-methyltransferase [Methylacidiphilales bacterium]|nr:site-specific DNA-methyltransferase [Candidatus Methylacidiphilales bacterium]
MEAQVDGFKFYFDASALEHKKANEKRELVFEFKEIRQSDGALVFTMTYSERGRQTDLVEIRRQIRNALGLTRYTDAVPSEATLERAFRVFERQSEVDYFLCKDAKGFLREQFDLWLWQYLLGKPGEEPNTEWTEARLKQLQALKRVAYRVIVYIAAFEDDLVKIWEKPKFVLNSHYVITLDRIVAREGGWKVLDKLLKHQNIDRQVQEWRELGMVDDTFTLVQLVEQDLMCGRWLNPRYQYLPVDTRYFKDLELWIRGLFDNLDDALDGWLIKSENYQALNTILPKWREKVQCIYIDPPFNLGKKAEYDYEVNYKDSTWLTMLENRLMIAGEMMSVSRSIFFRVGHDGNMLVRLLMDLVFGRENYRNEIIVRRAEESKGEFTKQFDSIKGLTVNYDNLYWYSKNAETRFPHIVKPASSKHAKAQWHSFWKAEDRPTLRYQLLGELPQKGQWMWEKHRALRAVENYQEYLKMAQATG